MTVSDDRFGNADVSVQTETAERTVEVEFELISTPTSMLPHIDMARWADSEDSALAFVGAHHDRIMKVINTALGFDKVLSLAGTTYQSVRDPRQIAWECQ